MAPDDRSENRCGFLPQLTPVVKSPPGTSFIHKEPGRKYRLKLAQGSSKQHITGVPVQTSKFPSKVIILLEIREEVALFHLNFIYAISLGVSGCLEEKEEERKKISALQGR